MEVSIIASLFSFLFKKGYGFVLFILVGFHYQALGQITNDTMRGNIKMVYLKKYKIEPSFVVKDDEGKIDPLDQKLLDKINSRTLPRKFTVENIHLIEEFFELADSVEVYHDKRGMFYKSFYFRRKEFNVQIFELVVESYQKRNEADLIEKVTAIEKTYYGRDTFYYSTTKMDERGQILTQEKKNRYGRLVNKSEYHYSADYTKRYSTFYSKDRRTFEFTPSIPMISTFDELGNIIKYTDEDMDIVYDYEYTEFDELGNWTKQIEFSSDSYYPVITTRTIVYYIP